MTVQTNHECDLVMKGGVTSGVVYPLAVKEIASAYRLRDIGGTSAGAIAAVFAAAAEYRRQTSTDQTEFEGFEEVGRLADELSNLKLLMQPSRPMRRLFKVFLAVVDAKSRPARILAAVTSILVQYWFATLAGLIIGGCFYISGAYADHPAAEIAAGISSTLVLALLLPLICAAAQLFYQMPKEDFGLCPGKTQPGHGQADGFSDWIIKKVDLIAGKSGEPLLVGDLKKMGIQVATMTTDLSSQRPYQLPMKNNRHSFSEKEFDALFPKEMVDYLKRAGGKIDNPPKGAPRDCYWLPSGDKFPVALVARMSLSFPGLIRAVPLYRRDFGVKTLDNPKGEIRRCLFSDGGISSNFPVHMFDRLLPSRPTFGIALATWERARHKSRRVKMMPRFMQTMDVPVRNITSVGGFAMSIVNSAKDWQDTLTTQLPGYSDRIVEVRLDPKKEGGLNLTMDKPTIKKLTRLGCLAGRKLVTRFDHERHYYIRAIAMLSKMEVELSDFKKSLKATPCGINQAYDDLMLEYKDPTFGNSRDWRQNALLKFATLLADVPATDEEIRKTINSGHVPAADARIGMIAEADRVPRQKD